jgi:hypothetical protein
MTTRPFFPRCEGFRPAWWVAGLLLSLCLPAPLHAQAPPPVKGLFAKVNGARDCAYDATTGTLLASYAVDTPIQLMVKEEEVPGMSPWTLSRISPGVYLLTQGTPSMIPSMPMRRGG